MDFLTFLKLMMQLFSIVPAEFLLVKNCHFERRDLHEEIIQTNPVTLSEVEGSP